MNHESLLLAGGFFNLGFAIFHLLFWKLFDWRNDLKSLSIINRAVTQILNWCLTYVFILFAVISFAFPSELLAKGLGEPLLGFIATFWLFRAILQGVYFKLRKPVSILIFVIFLVGAAIYYVPFAAQS